MSESKCYCVLNPGTDIPRKFKLKEHYLRAALREEFKEVEMVFDKCVDNGCSARRPDVRIERLTHTIIIECDENRHSSYTEECENKRMMEIFQDLGNRPIVFLRFNPDSYQGSRGCFSFSGNGEISVNEEEWQKRVKMLIERIDYWFGAIPVKEVTLEKLFY